MQIVILSCLSKLKGDKERPTDGTVYTLNIINWVGVAYIGILLIVFYFLEENNFLKRDNIDYFVAVAAFLYLGITIATCVYAYQLPEKDEDISVGCSCEFEKYSSLLRVFCVVATICSALYGGVVIAFKLFKKKNA